MRCVVGLVEVAALGCTKPNPHACGDGVCDDPQFPFCDTQGTLGGAKNECIAVTCTAGEFAECRGDTSVVCDATGASYELQECVRGCDADTGGCHIDPSNDLGQYYDMVPDPPDMEVVSGTIDTSSGTIDGANAIPNFLVAAPPGGVPIRVFVVHRARLVEVSVVAPKTAVPPPALAIVATGDITVENSIALRHSPNTAPGTIDSFSEDCTAEPGSISATSGTRLVSGGNGGGGNADAGGAGGSVTGSSSVGGSGGKAIGTETLIPLRGSCRSKQNNVRGDGGGALQLSSMTKIRILGNVDVRGEAGGRFNYYVTGTQMVWEIGGGGAGGAGASRESDGGDDENGTPSTGAPCGLTSCGAGGAGASAGVAAMNGVSVPVNSDMEIAGGGGGGGLGRLRVNTADATYVSSPTTIMAASTTTGQISRR